MKRLIPVLLLTLLIPACTTNDEAPTEPGPELPATVNAPPQATVPPRPQETPVPASPPNQVLKFNPIPPIGAAPFVFQVNMCLSTTDLPGYHLNFSYDYGDGTKKGGPGVCRNQHTYTRTGSFRGVFCVSDPQPGHKVCSNLNVFVS